MKNLLRHIVMGLWIIAGLSVIVAELYGFMSVPVGGFAVSYGVLGYLVGSFWGG